MPTWVDAMKRSKAVIIDDVEGTSPQEYSVYRRLEVKTLLGVPFEPNPMGFFVVRNPTRYRHRTSAMNIFAYILHRAMAQRNGEERAKMALTSDKIKSDSDMIINFFGNMEIYTQDGVWREQEFNSPKSSRVIAYILLKAKSSHSALEIADALYPEETADVDTINKNIRGYIYRFRKSFGLISKHNLIEYSPLGYRLNPAIHVMTDLEKFDGLWELSQTGLSFTLGD